MIEHKHFDVILRVFSEKKNAELAEKFKNEGNVFYKNAEYRKSIDLYNKAIGEYIKLNLFCYAILKYCL